MKSVCLYLVVLLAFWTPLFLFVFGIFHFLPKTVALLIIALSGMVVTVAGPIWVLQIEAFFRRKFNMERKG